jgi:hypothetical protein
MVNKKFEKIGVYEKTSQQIHFIARALNKPISTLLSELFSEMIATCFQFEEGCNINYQREYDYLKIKFDGCPRIKVGMIKGIPDSVSGEEQDKLVFEETKKALGEK